MDKDILCDEYVNLRKETSSYSPETPYYVYSLCYPNGEPFYIGKGKDTRAFDHLKNYINDNVKNKYMKSQLDILGDEPPIMFINQGNMNQHDALLLEEHLIAQYGRILKGGTLSNIMPGGAYSEFEYSSYAGKLGGKKTKESGKGIFADDYDRGAQTKSNWENGLMDHIDFEAQGFAWGMNSVDIKLGIHDPKYACKRKEWSQKANASSLEKGIFGFCSPEYMTTHKEEITARASANGKKNGKVVGSMFWWNNGTKNTKAFKCPDGFVRGQLQSEKKMKSNRKNFNLKDNNE